MLKIEWNIWDNNNTTFDKQEILNCLERKLHKTAREYWYAPRVKIENRFWGGFTAVVETDRPVEFLNDYIKKIHRLHYWSREDEPLELHWELT